MAGKAVALEAVFWLIPPAPSMRSAAGDGQGNACFCFQLVTVHVQRERPSRRPAEHDILGQILSQRYRRDSSVIRRCTQSGL